MTSRSALVTNQPAVARVAVLLLVAEVQCTVERVDRYCSRTPIAADAGLVLGREQARDFTRVRAHVVAEADDIRDHRLALAVDAGATSSSTATRATAN